MDSVDLKRYIVSVFSEDHTKCLRSQCLQFLLSFSQSVKKHVQNVMYAQCDLVQWHERQENNDSNSSHHRGRGNQSSDNFGKNKVTQIAEASTQRLKVDLPP